MLFISEQQHDVGVIPATDQYSNSTGRRTGMSKRVYAQFNQGGIPDWALEKATKSFEMRGRPVEIEPRRYLCMYDSVADQAACGYTDAEREAIEQRLLRTAGIVPIEPDKVTAPWPAYDKLVVHGQRKIDHVVQKIIDTVKENGYDPTTVIAYERQEHNRPDVIAALEGLLRTADDEQEQVIAA